MAWFTGLQHCAELGAGWGLEGMMDYLLSDERTAKKARQKYLFKIIPIVNVDSVSEGKGRSHYSGKNLNREWEKANPSKEIATIRQTMDCWIKRGNSIDVFIDFHGFSGKSGGDGLEDWYFVLLTKKIYKDRSAEYERLIEALKKYVPGPAGINPSIGFASGMAGRKYKALSLAVDGWVYPIKRKRHPTLSSHYEEGTKVWPLKNLKASAKEFIRALVDFSDFDDVAYGLVKK